MKSEWPDPIWRLVYRDGRLCSANDCPYGEVDRKGVAAIQALIQGKPVFQIQEPGENFLIRNRQSQDALTGNQLDRALVVRTQYSVAVVYHTGVVEVLPSWKDKHRWAFPPENHLPAEL